MNYSRNSAAVGGGDLAYFDYNFVDECAPESWKFKSLFSFLPCSLSVFDAIVTANISDELNGFVFYWLSDLQFKAVALDYFNNFAGPEEISLNSESLSCNQYYYDYNLMHECFSEDVSDNHYAINSIHNVATLMSNNHRVCSCLNIDDKSATSLVVNFNKPFTVDVYIHAVDRTSVRRL